MKPKQEKTIVNCMSLPFIILSARPGSGPDSCWLASFHSLGVLPTLLVASTCSFLFSFRTERIVHFVLQWISLSEDFDITQIEGKQTNVVLYEFIKALAGNQFYSSAALLQNAEVEVHVLLVAPTLPSPKTLPEYRSSLMGQTNCTRLVSGRSML